MTIEIDQLCDRALAAKEPEGLSSALGIPLRLADHAEPMEYYEGAFPSGVFASADLRVNRSTGLRFLVLDVREKTSIDFAHVKLNRYGSAPVAIEANPRIPPEGTVTYLYDVNGVRVAFQFTARSKLLRLVSFEWPAGQ